MARNPSAISAPVDPPIAPPATIKTTTIRETIPVTQIPGSGRGSSAVDYWDFVRNRINDANFGEYIHYLYRDEPTRVQIDHTGTRHWEPPGYGMIHIGDQEALEAVIARDCGGGQFQLIVKQRSTGSWISSTKFRIDIPARPITPWLSRRPVPGTNGTDTGAPRYLGPQETTAQIASKAIDAISGQEHAAVNIGLDVMNTAAGLIKNFAANPPNGNGGMDETTKQILNILIQRAFTPPPDPIELLAKVLGLQAQINPTSNSGNPLMGRIMDVALTRLIEPISTSPAVSAGAEMVRSLPSIAGQVVEGIREWRMGMEAQRDGVMAMHQPAAPPQPGRPQPQVLQPARPLPPSSIATPSVNPAVANPGGIVPPSTEFVEMKIVEVFRKPVSAEEAAEEALDFLYTLDGPESPPEKSYVESLAKMGETGLHQLFQMRPILQIATQNSGRLLDFIRAFLRLYQEEQKPAGEIVPPKPN